ncbi:MAG: hypothetical protein IJU99_02855 [Lachnospiraceae bacterium]|nr:hypothetical protein [Lachnospiraceae bacterium]
MRKWWMRGVALLLAAVMLTGCGAKGGQNTSEGPGAKQAKAAEVKAELPEAVSRPKESDFLRKDGALDYEAYQKALNEWMEKNQSVREGASEAAAVLAAFYEKALPVFLGKENGENKVFSPLNVYLALAMLAEITDGESRAQILALLGADDIETVREGAKILWMSNYTTDDDVTSLLANSLWLNEDVNYNEETLKTLAKEHFASSFAGKCGSEEMNQKLRDWLNENTKGLLKEAADGMELTPETVIALASTIYFKANWTHAFEESQNRRDIFHGAEGDREVWFMHQTEQMIYHRGAHVTIVGVPMLNNGFMFLILPDEGRSAESVFADADAMEALKDGNNGYWQRVNLSVPKFDVNSNFDLVEGLKELGVTDVFDAGKSDYSPLGDVKDVYLSRVAHAARVKIDEHGLEAAAFTMMKAEGNAYLPEEPVEVVVDRPFGFVVTGADGSMLFTGVVNVLND